MPHTHNIELVKTVMDQLMAGNPEPLLSSISDDAVIKAVISDGTPLSGDFRGREGFVRYLEALHEVMEILHIETYDYAASDDHVVMLGVERARVRLTGKQLESDTATVFEFNEAGEITKLVALADMSAITDAYLVRSIEHRSDE